MAFLLLPWINGMSKTPKTIRSGRFQNCLICNTQYYVKKYQFDTSKYCSRKCLGLASRDQIKTKCLICKKEFEHISSRCNKAKYCSNSCRYKSYNTKGTIRFNCQYCGKEFLGSPYDIGKRKFCSKKCVGKKSKKTFKPNFTTVRKAMLVRGLITKCNRCNYSEFPQLLGVHHKDRNRQNNDLSNLEVLCPMCHSLEHMKHITI